MGLSLVSELDKYRDEGIRGFLTAPEFGLYLVGILSVLMLTTSLLSDRRTRAVAYSISTTLFAIAFLLGPAVEHLIGLGVFGAGAVFVGVKVVTED